MIQLKIEKIDFIFLLIFFFLFLIVILDLYFMEIRFVFEHQIVGESIFGHLSSTLVCWYFILWGFLRMREHFKKKEGFKNIISKAFRFVGLSKPSSRDLAFLLCSVFIGAVVSMFNLLLISSLTNGKLRLSGPPQNYTMLQSYVVAPIIEELVYRGIYLSVFLKILGKNYVTAIFGLIVSSFAFGWIHPTMPIIKVLAGLVLGAIYLFKWRKNLAASISAHVGANVVATFVLIEIVS